MKDVINSELADAPSSVAAQLFVARQSLDDLEARVTQLESDLAALEQEIEAGAEITSAVDQRRKEWTSLRNSTLSKIAMMEGFVARLESMAG